MFPREPEQQRTKMDLQRLAWILSAIVAGVLVLPATGQIDAAGQDSTVVVRGIVLENGTGQPVPRARVTPLPDPPRRTDDARAFAPAMTDTLGSFELVLPAGRRVVLRASRAGYLPGLAGQRDPLEPGRNVLTSPESASVQVIVPVWLPAAIEGQVLDDRNEPAIASRVEAFRVDSGSDRVDARIAGADDTDDRGIFRISGLWPGQYVVAAAEELPLPAGGQASRAGLPGRGVQVVAVPRTFHPLASSVDVAARVEAVAGETAEDVNIVLQRGAFRAVTGRVGGLPLDARVRLFDTSAADRLEVARTVTGDGGRFDFPAVRPGSYEVEAVILPNQRAGRQLQPPARSGGGGANARGLSGRGSQSNATYWSRQAITVDTNDVDVGTMAVLPGVSISGQVVRLNGSADTPPPLLALTVVSVDSGDLGAMGLTAIGPDGSFETPGLPPGRYRLRAAAGPGWFFDGLQQAGDWVDGERIDVAFTHITDVSVVVSDRPTRVEGRVLDPDGLPVAGATVYVVPSDPADRVLATHATHKEAVSGPDGAYVFEGLQRGEYTVTASAEPVPGFWKDVRNVASPASDGQRIVLEPAQTLQIDLRARR